MEMHREMQMIPVAKIHILNPRNRDAKKFAQITRNISNLGLKRPIVVSRRAEHKADTEFDLVCGQGRLEAVIKLGANSVPAIVVDFSREDRLLGSLIENCARRTPRMHEMARQIADLRDSGYSHAEIARKTDMDDTTVSNLINLYDNGEERLLQAVENGRIPITVAVIIATVDDHEVQNALAEAYEHKGLRGKPLLRARNLVEQRRNHGKQFGRISGHKAKKVTSDSIVRAYEQESRKQKLAVKKAQICARHLLFAVNAMKELLLDEHFRTLLRAEKLDTMPAYVAEQIGER